MSDDEPPETPMRPHLAAEAAESAGLHTFLITRLMEQAHARGATGNEVTSAAAHAIASQLAAVVVRMKHRASQQYRELIGSATLDDDDLDQLLLHILVEVVTRRTTELLQLAAQAAQDDRQQTKPSLDPHG